MFCLEEKKQSFEIFIKTSRSKTLLQKKRFPFRLYQTFIDRTPWISIVIKKRISYILNKFKRLERIYGF